MISRLIFDIACWVLLIQCAYLVFAKCYKTGLFGSIGLGMIGMGIGSLLLETWGNGTWFEFLPQAQWTVIGITLYLSQVIWRTVYHARLNSVVLNWRKIKGVSSWI